MTIARLCSPDFGGQCARYLDDRMQRVTSEMRGATACRIINSARDLCDEWSFFVRQSGVTWGSKIISATSLTESSKRSLRGVVGRSDELQQLSIGKVAEGYGMVCGVEWEDLSMRWPRLGRS
jgi:hypothetical protein